MDEIKGKVINVKHPGARNSQIPHAVHFSGIRRYTQTALVLGLDSEKLNYSASLTVNTLKHDMYFLEAWFNWNRIEHNETSSQKANFLMGNSIFECFPEHLVDRNPDRRLGVIRIPYDSAVKYPINPPTVSEAIIASSGIPSLNTTLLAAYAIGMHEADPNWNLKNFTKNANGAYAFGLHLAARSIAYARLFQLKFVEHIDCPEWHEWFTKGERPIVCQLVEQAQADLVRLGL